MMCYAEVEQVGKGRWIVEAKLLHVGLGVTDKQREEGWSGPCGDLILSHMTIVTNIVLYTWNLLREWILVVLIRQKKNMVILWGW